MGKALNYARRGLTYLLSWPKDLEILRARRGGKEERRGRELGKASLSNSEAIPPGEKDREGKDEVPKG